MRKTLVTVLVILSLVACAPLPEPDSNPTATLEARPPVIEPGTVVASGNFDGATATGLVEIVALEAGFFETRLTDFETSLVDYRIELSPEPLTNDRTCLDMLGFELPSVDQWTDDATPIGDCATMGGSDPSFLDGLVLVQRIEADVAASDCVLTIVARAPFDWDLPDIRPGFVVVDSGSTGGATGELTLIGGMPASYTVAAGDVTEEIAARLGITVHDIAWLNPFRGNSTAIAGETVNLDRNSRGAPLS
jgi:hypothetical protein